ncbi:bifunctional serine/threonine protein kinase/MFS transporter [Streptomyces indicus]|uniref:Serine/threonine protein kinase n=1 Tax=Streptomyces indicus TaxID=417292 RepID=A0A1G9CF01_9ACTN|nr:bifunctional serine/threonine protein kinase/MFS transporter [Streptomyces indicus]SDK50034.1 Serine/threonine protein kinase [Streptomyces indicus]
MDQLITEDPTSIGPYRLIARLGAGGMGLVYLGRSEAGRTVAVKVVQAEHAAHPEFRRRFAREVAAARRVGGAWTADVLDADTEAEVPWVATQYIPGPDLATVVAKDYGPLPEPSLRTLAHRLAEALTAVHGAGLIHRDLKPSNVLVTVDGPRVIDFGIARAMDGLAPDSLLTHTGMLIGSPGFMSPEQVRGLELTPASDVFCLGSVLVYAATGRLLFGAGSTGLNAHLFRVAEEEPDLTGVPAGLLDLVQDCLHKDPARRPTPAQIMERTADRGAEEWLPGQVLAQLGRHAAQLLDFAPPTRAPSAAGPRVPDPRVPVQPDPPAPEPAAPVPQQPPRGAPAGGPSPAAYTPTAPAAPPRPSSGGSRAPLVVAALAQLIVVLEFAVTAMMADHLVREGVLPTEDVRWLHTGYLLAFGALLPAAGHLGDRIGRRTTLLIGLCGCLLSVLTLALLPGGEGVTALRVVQGASAALVTSSALGTVAAGAGQGPARVRRLGTYALVGAGGPLFAFPLAALHREFAVWRVVLYAIAALTLGVLVAAVAVRDRSPRSRARLDTAGVVLSVLGLLAIGLAFDTAVIVHWTAPVTLVLFLTGALLLAAFFRQQSRSPHAMLPAYLWQDRGRRGALLALGLAGVALGVAAQGQVAITLPRSGAELATVALLTVAVFLFAARILGPRLSGVARQGGGLLLTAGGLVPLGYGDEAGYFAGPAPALLGCALGLGLACGPLFAAVTDVAPADTGGTAGLVGAVLQAAALTGTALAVHPYGDGFALIGRPLVVPDGYWWIASALLAVAAAVGVGVRARGEAAPAGS